MLLRLRTESHGSALMPKAIKNAEGPRRVMRFSERAGRMLGSSRGKFISTVLGPLLGRPGDIIFGYVVVYWVLLECFNKQRDVEAKKEDGR